MVYHRYNYNGCGQFYDRANVQDWTGGARIGAALSHLDCRTVSGLTNGQMLHKNTGQTRSLGFHLSAAPVNSMLNASLSEETSWSSSLDQWWTAQSSSQNYLCGAGLRSRWEPEKRPVQASNESVITAGRSGLASPARRVIAVVVILVIAAGAALWWRAAQGSSRPPAAVITASPGVGWEAGSPVTAGVQTYGGQWLFNLDRAPITLTRVRLVGVTAGFHVVTIRIAGQRRSNELNIAGYPTSVAPHTYPVAGYVLVPLDHHPPRRLAQTGELQVAYRVSGDVRAAGFRDIEIDYRFRGAAHTLLLNSAFTACPIGTGTVSQASAYCQSHQLHTAAHFSNR